MTEAQKKVVDKSVANALKEYGKETGQYFDIVCTLGVGGFGVVYEVRNKKTKETMALKAVDNTISETLKTIDKLDKYAKDEIRALKKCQGHPNIMPILGAFYYPPKRELCRKLYLIFMPKLEPVDEYFKKYGCDEKSIFAMTSDICKALSFCHKNDILHRDVKPSNIYYSYENQCFVLADFGSIRSGFDPARAVTAIGTVTYVAPEIQAGMPLQDEFGNKRYNADVYSLGVSTLVLLAKFNANGVREEYLKHTMPEGLRVVLSKSTALDPNLRYQTADEFRAAIDRIEWNREAPVYADDIAECVKILISGKQSKAKEIAERGHRNGNIRMTCVLAYILSIEGKAKEAIAMLEKIKHTGDRVVLGLYGIIGCTYFGGTKEHKDCMLKSADMGFCLAQYFIGRWICDGQNGFKENFKKGFEYIYTSATQGFMPAVRYMGKALKRHKVHDSDAMIDLLGAELDNYNHDKDFPIYCVQAIAIG